jgi:anti-anti-sigma regulatory factor
MSEPFELPAELNIYSVMEIRDALLAWVTEQGSQGVESLVISARKVAEVDGSGLQLLAALSNMQQTWQLVAPTEVFAEACRTLGFAHWLEAQA